jgi:hypothetical protein
MSWIVNFLIIALVGAAVPAIDAPTVSAARDNQPPNGRFMGVPRDIDFIKNLGWTQVILQGPVPTDSLVAQTQNDQIESILLVALSLKSEVAVSYVEGNPKKLTSVSLAIKAKEEQGYVFSLSVDQKDNYYRAVIFDHSKKVDVWTKSAQMQNILETAVRQSIPVQEFTFDATTMEITRGKVNVELRK